MRTNVTSGGKALFTDLSKGTQERFGYDPRAAAEFQEAKRKANAAAAAADAAQLRAARIQHESEQRLRQMQASKMYVEGKVLQKVSEGLLVDSGTQRMRNSTASKSGVNQYGGVWSVSGGSVKLYTHNVQVYIGLCLLTDHPNYNGLADGDSVQIPAWPNGEFQYTAVSGGSRTVRTFTADFSKMQRPLTASEEEAMRQSKGR